MTNWDFLPDDVVKIIFNYRKLLTCQKHAIIKIQSKWRYYKIRILIGRFKMLRYLQDFRYWNPSIYEFLSRSRL